MLFVVVFIVLCALLAIEYCVGSSDCGVWSGDYVFMLLSCCCFHCFMTLIALENCVGSLKR